MVDVSDVMGETPLYTSIQKKRAKVKERLDKHNAKIAEWLETKKFVTAPLEQEVAMYDKMLAAMDEKAGTVQADPAFPEENPENKPIEIANQ